MRAETFFQRQRVKFMKKIYILNLIIFFFTLNIFANDKIKCGKVEVQGKLQVDNIGNIVLIANKGNNQSTEYVLKNISAKNAFKYNGVSLIVRGTAKRLMKDSVATVYIESFEPADMKKKDGLRQKKIAVCDEVK